MNFLLTPQLSALKFLAQGTLIKRPVQALQVRTLYCMQAWIFLSADRSSVQLERTGTSRNTWGFLVFAFRTLMEIQFRETQNCHVLWEAPGCEWSTKVNAPDSGSTDYPMKSEKAKIFTSVKKMRIAFKSHLSLEVKTRSQAGRKCRMVFDSQLLLWLPWWDHLGISMALAVFCNRVREHKQTQQTFCLAW